MSEQQAFDQYFELVGKDGKFQDLIDEYGIDEDEAREAARVVFLAGYRAAIEFTAGANASL